MIRWVSLATLLALALPAAAPAAVAVVSNGHARSCFEAAERDRPARDALRKCNHALDDDRLPQGDWAATLVNRGIVQMQARNIAAAIADYDAAIKAAPDIADAYVNKGIALLRLGEHDAEAVKQLTEGLSRNPPQPAIAYYSRAVANEQLGRTREAYEDYSRAAQLAPEWAEPVEQLQRFRVVKGKTLQG